MTNEEYIEQLTRNAITLEDTIDFKCKGCGDCCRNREDIMLTPFDMYRISKALKLKPMETFDRYCESYIGHTSHVPIVRLRPKPYGKACPLLQNGKCIVHKLKPVVCALYPLGRFWDANTKQVSYTLQKPKCGAKSEKHTIKSWLAKYDIPESDESMLLWSDFVMHSSKLLGNNKIPPERKEMPNQIFFLIMYLSYDIEKEFIPQFKLNLANCKRLINEVLS